MNNSTQDIFRVSCKLLQATHSFKTELSSEKSLVHHIFVFVCNSILIIPTILLNAVAIVTILKSSQLNSKPCYFIIVIQSVIDLTIGVLGIPSFLVYMLGKMGVYANCAGSLFGHTTTILMIDISTIVVSAMTLERYIAVLHPFLYKILVTKKRILLYVCIGSTLFLVVVTLSLFFRRLIDGWIIAQSTILFLFTAFAYTRIFSVVKNLAWSQKRLHDVDAAAEGNLSKAKLFLREIKHAKSCYLVVLCYLGLHYFPVMLTLYFKYAGTLGKFCTEIHIWVVTLGLINSSVNSMIFFWTKTALRKEAAKLMQTFRL